MISTPDVRDFLSFIASLEAVGPLSEKSIQDIRRVCRSYEISAKTSARASLNSGVGVAFVVHGLVTLTYPTRNSRDLIKSFCTSGAIIGDLMPHESEMQFDIVAFEPTRLLAVESPDFVTMLEDCEDLRHLSALFAQKLALKKIRRERSLLTFTAQERFQEFLNEFPDLARRLPQKLIAAYLGITPEALSRIRAREKVKYR